MTYRIELSKDAEKFLLKQPSRQQARIVEALMKLPAVGDIKKMSGHDDLYRLRVGDYRVIYRVEHQVLLVMVLQIGNRGDIYK